MVKMETIYTIPERAKVSGLDSGEDNESAS